jgi:hypothetical protein
VIKVIPIKETGTTTATIIAVVFVIGPSTTITFYVDELLVV